MPKRYRIPAWRDRGQVTVRFLPWWRNLPLLKDLPYHVGDRVRFHVHTDLPRSQRDSEKSAHYVYERFNGGQLEECQPTINGVDTDMEGSRIPREGSVEYAIGPSSLYGEPQTIITMKAEDWDTTLSSFFWMIVAAIVGGVVTVITGILMGYLQVAR